MNSTFSNNQHRFLGKPQDSSGRLFESMCLVIYGQVFSTHNAVFFGRRGQKQHGIDIRISTEKEMITIQCKDKKKLTLADLKDDLDASIEKWTSADADGLHHTFIIATTLESNAQLIEDVDQYVEQLREQRIQAGRYGKFSVTIHSWEKIDSIVKSNPSLSHHFFEQALDNDFNLRRHETNRFCDDLTKYVKNFQLNTAIQEWRNLHRKRGYVSYAEVPSSLRQQLLALFTLAGDFQEISELLNVEIGFRRYAATTRILNLRASRVLATTPEPGTLSIDEEVERTAHDLLQAIGTLDEQLTLACWVVMYAKTRETADLGLRRALGLLHQHWPAHSTFPSPLHTYAVVHGQLIVDDNMWPLPRPASKTTHKHERATALAHAYSFIRQVHLLRFGYPATLDTEREQGGWAKAIHPYVDPPLFAFYDSISRSQKSNRCQRFLSDNLPSFYQETTRGAIRVDTAVEFCHKFPPNIPSSGMVCSSDVLLADAREGTGKWRRKQVSLQSTHLSLERILAAHQLTQIQNNYFHRNFYDEMTALKQDWYRSECPSSAIQALIVSIPAYFDFPENVKADETGAGFMLSCERKTSFFFTAAEEIFRANHFPDKSLRLIGYWGPAHVRH